MEQLLLLLVGNSGFRLELIGGGYPPLVVTHRGVIGVDAVAHRGTGHKLGGVGAHAIIVHSAGVVPGDVAAALVRGPSVAPHHVQGRAHYMPGIPVHGVQVRDDPLWELDEREAQKCSFWINGPCHVGGVGFLSAGAAWVIGTHISGWGDIRWSLVRLGRLRREHAQGNTGISAVRRFDVIG